MRKINNNKLSPSTTDCFSVLKIVTLVMVLKLKSLTEDEDEFISDADERSSTHNVNNIEGQEEAVSFEPFLFSNLLLQH